MIESVPIDKHPVYLSLVSRYQLAISAWRLNQSVREVAVNFSMTEREYCDKFIGLNFVPLVWASGGTDTSLTQAHFDAAYKAAGGRDNLVVSYLPAYAAVAAEDAQVAAKIEEAKAAGGTLPTTRELGGYGSFESFEYHSPPQGCRVEACEQRIQALEGTRPIWVCTDPKCWKRLGMAATRAANKGIRADVADKLNKRIPEAVSWIGAPLPDGGNRELTSREVAVLAYYALANWHSTDALDRAAGLTIEDKLKPERALEAYAKLPPGRIAAIAIETILRHEQEERLKDYTNSRPTASDFFLGKEAKG